ncbi:MAG TPA: hypothetical protein VNH39_08470, partial [Steroidobacteraceae bacterium]|nr:hypothetical protein [Steroidobacteraceae bacterium]
MKIAAKTSLALVLFAFLAAFLAACRPAPYGLASRMAAKPYLQMPPRADGKIPLLLSQTGVFSDTAKRIPSKELIPYDLVVAFWSDGADKSRWIALPNEKIAFSATGEWRFPPGTVFVKNFDLPDGTGASPKRRLETRLLVCDSAGGVYGVVYKWRSDGSDADLIEGSRTEDIAIRSANGEVHRQSWYYPSRQDCLTCHTAN